MKKALSITVLLLTTVGLSGCGAWSRGVANITGHSKHCVDGVMYIQFLNGATVMYNRSGTIKTC